MAQGDVSPIDFVQGSLVQQAIVNMDRIAYILIYCSAGVSSTDVPSFSEGKLIGFDELKKQLKELAALETNDTEYLSDALKDCIERYQQTIDFYRYVLQSLPSSCSEGSASASPMREGIEHEESISSSSRYATPHQPGTSQEVTTNRASVVELKEPESPRTVTTIDFEDVYRGGTSATTHFILDYDYSLKAAPNVSGRWWILRCEQCDWHGLSQRPGTFHMELHPELRIDDLESAVEAFGVLVINCTAGLADTNNTHVRKVMEGRASEPSTVRARHNNKKRKVVKISVSPRSFAERELITDPSVGEMYLAGWADGKLYAAVAIPMGDFEPRTSILGNMWDPAHLSRVPTCYKINKRARHFSWAEGYEDGGTNVAFRQFPLFYFDNPKLDEGHVGWAYAHDIHPFDMTKITSGLTRPAALYTQHFRKPSRTPFSQELFSHDEGHIKPVSQHIPSTKHLEGEKSSSFYSTPQTTETETDTDTSHGRNITDGQDSTPSSDSASRSFDSLFDEPDPQPGTFGQTEDATFYGQTYPSSSSTSMTSSSSVGSEQGMLQPDPQIATLGEPGDEIIDQHAQTRECHAFATVNDDTWDMFHETHAEQAFIDAMENSVPTPPIIDEEQTIKQEGDE
ncbi:unnamed protein product [Clonostachys rosea]|uniref:Uncharacterized protein n=1 Tax=Bionectria ochroleuca TaxID=29856 RepID=A0ABY6U7B2_BIOOC|nr:unnamed protein product [Clonostachys rosea]